MITLWFVIVGSLLILMSLIGFAVDRLPLSAGVIYLFIGVILGAPGMGILDADPLQYANVLEVAFEITVLISLFSVGLKLKVPFSDRLWRLPLMLASTSMLCTIAILTATGIWLLHLPVGAAVLFSAILAPTDPVLASDVQVKNPDDRDLVRFSVTAEGGLNDGAAFPFVMLGLGLLGLRDLGAGWSHWLLIDVVWGVSGGLAVGAACGIGVGKLVLWLRNRRGEPLGLEEFLALGLIGLSYGVACLLHTLGFLAVLAAGLAMRRLESTPVVKAAIAQDPAPEPVLPVRMLQSVLSFNERFERIAEVAAVLLLGGMLSSGYFAWKGVALAAVLLFAVRPVSVFLGIRMLPGTHRQRWLISWFGVRGVSSLYYLMYALEAGLSRQEAATLLPLALTVVAVSIVAHGISGTPMMNLYSRRQRN
ncbi:MAG TPA: cation:proton antiporter [Rhodocyclaceae bacterium]|nr:cation:proton antiporter [Rhodocyclaceae bacterium]